MQQHHRHTKATEVLSIFHPQITQIGPNPNLHYLWQKSTESKKTTHSKIATTNIIPVKHPVAAKTTTQWKEAQCYFWQRQKLP